MNIFYLDEKISLCAKAHCDKHIVKMVLETAQILCTVLHKQGQTAPYRSTHRNHPSVLWAAESLENWLWLKRLGDELNKEYQYRFNHTKPHKSFEVIESLAIPSIESKGLTEHPQVMPDQYKVSGDPVSAYRHYYIGEKSHLLTYTKRSSPDWLTSFL